MEISYLAEPTLDYVESAVDTVCTLHLKVSPVRVRNPDTPSRCERIGRS